VEDGFLHALGGVDLNQGKREENLLAEEATHAKLTSARKPTVCPSGVEKLMLCEKFERHGPRILSIHNNLLA
jgi:hypothetical protein